MCKIVVSEFLSLNGIMEDPGGAEKSKYGGWSFLAWGPDAGKYKFDELFAADALLLGRITYEGFAKVWPSMSDPEGFADRMNHIPKFVVSTSLKNPEWNNATVLRTDLSESVMRLKATFEKDILVFGSAKLVNALHNLKLIDEYRFMVHPVILGAGRQLFTEDSGIHKLALKENRQLDSGIVILTYTRSAS